MKNKLSLVLMGFSLFGCAYHYPAGISTTSLSGVREAPVAIKSGESNTYYVLFFGPFGENSLQTAIQEAKKGTSADTIANVFVDRKLTFYPHVIFPIVTKVSTRVHGTLIRYEDANGGRPKSMVDEQAFIERARIEKVEMDILDLPKNQYVRLVLTDRTEFNGWYNSYKAPLLEIRNEIEDMIEKIDVKDINSVSRIHR
ncbi:MAG: hypothetical protein IPH01_10740 [Elusimicrobia bacterium]|nr:hypothetical protein [Elusimicrobiota bacterium]